MGSNLKQVLSWEQKRLICWNFWFVCYRKSWHLCMRCWACLRMPWFSMMSWMLCSHSTSSSLLQEVCITFVLHITHQVLHIVNQFSFVCEIFLQGWQELPCREYFSPWTSICYIFVIKNTSVNKAWFRKLVAATHSSQVHVNHKIKLSQIIVG